MKKILFYTDTPLLGGAENQMYLLAKFLPKEKYQVTLACSNFKKLNPWCQKFLEEGLNVLRLKVLGKHDPRHALYIKKILNDFDLMHIHVWNPASCRFGLMFAPKIPVIVTEHDPFELSGIKKWIKSFLSKKVKKIITASNAAKQIALKENEPLENLMTVVPNGIDTKHWKSLCELPDRNEFRRTHLKAMPNEKVILCAAELHERKGQKYLIQAIGEILTDFPGIKLVFAGDGPQRNYYEKMARPIKDRVVFLGHKRNVAQLMAASDIFVLPSIREAFGLVLIEAAIAGLPVIASRTGGIPEIIEDQKTGVLVEPANFQKLARAIALVINNPELAKDMVISACTRAETMFTAEEMAKKTAAIYDEVLI